MTRVRCHHNIAALLDTIAHTEIGPDMLNDPRSDDGYNILVGSLPGRIFTFNDYSDHPLPPGHAREYRDGIWSTAAGRYQILSKYWAHYKRQLNLPDFGPESQDRYAIQQIKEQRAIADIEAGRFEQAVSKCRNIWASLPGAGYGQREHSLEYMLKVYVDHGGTLHTEDVAKLPDNWYEEVDKRY